MNSIFNKILQWLFGDKVMDDKIPAYESVENSTKYDFLFAKNQDNNTDFIHTNE